MSHVTGSDDLRLRFNYRVAVTRRLRTNFFVNLDVKLHDDAAKIAGFSRPSDPLIEQGRAPGLAFSSQLRLVINGIHHLSSNERQMPCRCSSLKQGVYDDGGDHGQSVGAGTNEASVLSD